VEELKDLEEAVSEYVTRAAEKLRAQHSVAQQMMVFLATNRFKEGPQYNNALQIQLSPPSAHTPDLIKIALTMLHELHLPGFQYKKAGVMFSGLISEDDVPLNLLETNYLDDRRHDLIQAVDRLNRKHGRDTVFFASSGTKRDWQMKRARLSPAYTMRWTDLIRTK